MKESQEFETIDIAALSNTARSEVEHPASDHRDQQDLARLGKKQVLKVRSTGRHFCSVSTCS